MLNKETFYGVQFLRFFAAMLVVVTHATGSIAERMLDMGSGQYWRPGLSGVDIFFVISGFVMATSSSRIIGRDDAWKHFMIRRIVRVVPLYWIATTAKIAAAIIFTKLALHSRLDISYLLACYFFIPALNADGEVLPILTVGWTLSYEMFFYVIFALALRLKVLPIIFVACIFMVLSIVGIFRTAQWAPIITTFANPLILEFLMGMGVAAVYRKVDRINVLIPITMIIVGMIALLTMDSSAMKWRFLFWGIPATSIVAGFVLAEHYLGKRIPSLFVKFGDSSYSLYLFHPFVVPLIVVLLIKAGINMPVLALIACILSSLLIGVLACKFIERPVIGYIQTKFGLK